jgi:hypothetical protein
MGMPIIIGVMQAPRTISRVGPRLFGAERDAVIDYPRIFSLEPACLFPALCAVAAATSP